MTPDNQREALAVLSQLCSLAPDVRLRQLFAHLGFLGEVHVGKGLGDIDDDQMIALCYRHHAKLSARQQQRGLRQAVSAAGLTWPGSYPAHPICDCGVLAMVFTRAIPGGVFYAPW